MKKMRKIMSLLLATVMVLAMTTTAFAEETERTYNYEIYQIFTGTFENNELTNVQLGQNGKATDIAAALLELEGLKDIEDNQEKLDVILKYVDFSKGVFDTSTTGKFEGLAQGYYLVKDAEGSQDDDSYTTFIVKVVDGTLEIVRKDGVPTVDKVILDTTELKNNEASIGEKVNYQITGTLPTNIADYKEYYYVFNDTLSKGLTYNEDLTVTVNGVDVTKYFYKNDTVNAETGETKIVVGMQDLLALENLTDPVVGEITATTKVVLTYSATLNENAVIAGEGNPNVVDLTYYNNPNQSGNGTTTPPPENPEEEPKTTNPKGETPDSTVVTYTTELTIFKTDEYGKALEGAEFTLTSADGAKVLLVTEVRFVEDTKGTFYKLNDETYTEEEPTAETEEYYASTTVKYTKKTVVLKGENQEDTTIVGTVDENGYVTFTGLGVGTYTIEETKVPEGYNKADNITFKLTFDYETNKFVSDNENVKVGEDNKLDTTIVNRMGTTLPETGGIGTTIFYAIGAILVLGAAVTLITRKRMSK